MVPLVVIVGGTASGKSALAMELAKRFEGEIICADSQTIRRGMDIGTAKPSKQDQKAVRHHLLDIIDPYERFSAAQFKKLAFAAIEEISARNHLPILVGGTGLYIDAVIFNYTFGPVSDLKRRQALSDKSVDELQSLHRKRGIDLPVNASNPRHLIRSLESGGLKALDKTMRPNTLVIGIDLPKDELSRRIEQRTDSMLRAGFIDEVRSIVAKYGYPPVAWDAIGYKVALKWLDGHEDAPEDIEYVRNALIIASRQYAKRQRTWFKRNPSVQWVADPKKVVDLVTTFLSKNQ